MESVEREKAALITGIEADARAEEQKIIEEAQMQAAEKREHGEKKIASLLEEARTKAQEQADAVRKKIIATAEREVKRRSMRARDDIMRDVMERVEKRLRSMITDDNYRSVLLGWLVEAAVGLDAEAAVVNASADERNLIDDRMLSEAKERLRGQTGKDVALTLSDGQPLKSQGVVLTAADGHTAFNNQVKTRMLRSKREIQRLIYEALFTENQKKNEL